MLTLGNNQRNNRKSNDLSPVLTKQLFLKNMYRADIAAYWVKLLFVMPAFHKGPQFMSLAAPPSIQVSANDLGKSTEDGLSQLPGRPRRNS